MARTIPVLLLAFSCSVLAGCAEDDPPTTPIETPTEFTENFTGSLGVLSANMHTFVTSRSGQAVVQITALAPDSAAVISLQFGTWNGNNCQLVLVKDDATTGSSVIGTASVGAFCVRVADIGRLTAPTDYEIRVTHF